MGEYRSSTETGVEQGAIRPNTCLGSDADRQRLRRHNGDPELILNTCWNISITLKTPPVGTAHFSFMYTLTQ